MEEKSVQVNFLDPDFVRLASYLAAAGKTWRDSETGGLKTIIRGRFLETVYPLFRKFFPVEDCSLLGDSKMVRGKVIRHVTFRIDDSDVLEMIEAGGFKLGSRHRIPPVYVVNNAELFKIYLRVIWEVHGRVLEVDPPSITLEQKYAQELAALHQYLQVAGIESEFTRKDGNFHINFEGVDQVKPFMELMDWAPDADLGKYKIDMIREGMKLCQQAPSE